MATIPTPTIHEFKEINSGKYSSVKHYELEKINNGSSLLTKQLNISKDRKFARSTPDYWLKIRDGRKWSRPITGLFKTSSKNVYKGDCNYKKHLLIIKFTEDHNRAIVYYFKNFFTADLKQVLPLIQ
jgi:hypothetical protein